MYHFEYCVSTTFKPSVVIEESTSAASLPLLFLLKLVDQLCLAGQVLFIYEGQFQWISWKISSELHGMTKFTFSRLIYRWALFFYHIITISKFHSSGLYHSVSRCKTTEWSLSPWNPPKGITNTFRVVMISILQHGVAITWCNAALRCDLVNISTSWCDLGG